MLIFPAPAVAYQPISICFLLCRLFVACQPSPYFAHQPCPSCCLSAQSHHCCLFSSTPAVFFLHHSRCSCQSAQSLLLPISPAVLLPASPVHVFAYQPCPSCCLFSPGPVFFYQPSPCGCLSTQSLLLPISPVPAVACLPCLPLRLPISLVSAATYQPSLSSYPVSPVLGVACPHEGHANSYGSQPRLVALIPHVLFPLYSSARSLSP